MTEIICASISGMVAITVCLITNRASNKKLLAENTKQTKAQAEEENAATRKGLQALLRDRLYSVYNKCKYEQGYAKLYQKENFLNMYTQYHQLGSNGVMDQIKEEFMDLPTEPLKNGGN